MLERRGTVEEAEQKRLVIALEEMRVESVWQSRQEDVDDAPAVGSAIHVVPEKDERLGCRAAARDCIRGDRIEETAQQIGPAVNIADGVEQPAFWQRRMIQALVRCQRHGRHSNANGGRRASYVFSDLPLSS